MKLPTQITFRNMKSSEAVETCIHEEVAKLETFYDQIISCRVMVETPHRHHQRGIPIHIRIDLGVPGGEIVVNHEPSLHGSLQKTAEPMRSKKQNVEATHKDAYLVIRDAFKTLRRQLQQFARRQKREIKQHQSQPLATVSRLFPEKDYGFLQTPEGEEIYFHRNSLLNVTFDQLTPGAVVTYVEAPGEKGLQASTVRLQGKSAPARQGS